MLLCPKAIGSTTLPKGTYPRTKGRIARPYSRVNRRNVPEFPKFLHRKAATLFPSLPGATRVMLPRAPVTTRHMPTGSLPLLTGGTGKALAAIVRFGAGIFLVLPVFPWVRNDGFTYY